MSISYLAEIAEKIRHEDKPSILDIRNEVNDPITEELCLAFIQYYIQNGRVNSRWVKYEGEPERGKNSLLAASFLEDNNQSNRDAMNHALEIIMSESQKGHFYVFNRVNSEYKKEIFNLYYSGRLEHYLNTGEADTDMSIFLDGLYKDCYGLNEMSGGTANSCFLDSCDNSGDFRFYINMPINEETVLFVRDYQILCQELGIPFKMKAFMNRGAKDKDVTILYSLMEDLPTQISILRELLRVYPDMQLGAPPIACASLKDLPSVGLCNIGVKMHDHKNYATYNDVINRCFELVFDYFASLHFVNSSSFSETTKEGMKKQLNLWERIRSEDEVTHLFIRQGSIFTSEENLQVREYLSNMMSDPLRKKVTVAFFMENIRVAYNAINGLPSGNTSNIAFDAWYINEKIGQMQHPQPQNGSYPKR